MASSTVRYFTMYTTPLSDIINKFKPLEHCLYADDTQIYVSLTPETAPTNLNTLQNCLLAVQEWMVDNMLKLNPDKTEFLVLGSPNKRDLLSSLFPIELLGSMITPTQKVRNLGVMFDSDFCLGTHVSTLYRSCFYHLKDLSRIRRSLSLRVATALANALVGSKLDYCKSLLFGIQHKHLRKLQSLQNILCRIVSRLPIREHITNNLKKLHWLPIKFRIIFKINTITYKTIHTGLPSYLRCFLNPYTCSVNTRCSSPS